MFEVIDLVVKLSIVLLPFNALFILWFLGVFPLVSLAHRTTQNWWKWEKVGLAYLAGNKFFRIGYNPVLKYEFVWICVGFGKIIFQNNAAIDFDKYGDC